MFVFYFSCINCESINESGAGFGVVDSFLCLNCRSLRQNLKTTQALAILQTTHISDLLIHISKRSIHLTSLYIHPVTYIPDFLIYRLELSVYLASLYIYSNRRYIRPPYIFGLSICTNSLYYLALIRSW